MIGRSTLVGAALVAATHAMAQTFPTRPIRIITPVVPGSAPDLRVRQIAPKLAESLGQPVIVENRPGGNGMIGAREAARTAPDGHTLFNANINNAINDSIAPDPTTRLTYELIAITDMAQSPLIMVVNPTVPVNTVREYIEYAQANPRALTAPDVRDPVIASGSELGGMPPERFTAYVRDEVAKWGKVIGEAGIRLK